MPREVVSIANRQRLDVAVTGTEGANRLLIYTGVAVLTEKFAQDNTLVRQEVDIILGPNSIADPNLGDNFSGHVLSLVKGVASVALAVIQALEDSDQVTWGVDEATVEEVFIDPATKFLRIRTQIAFQGEFHGILRLSYHADVLAIAAEEEAQLKSFTLVPDHISAPVIFVGKGVSRATVTVDRPAPATGIALKISAKSPIPNLVSFPSNVIIGTGQSSVLFDVTTTAPPMPATEVVMQVSFGPQTLAAKLTVT